MKIIKKAGVFPRLQITADIITQLQLQFPGLYFFREQNYKKVTTMQNTYTIWIVSELPGIQKPRFVPWKNVYWENAARWEKTKKDIMRLYPFVHHVIVRNERGDQVAYYRKEYADLVKVEAKPSTRTG